VERALQLQKLIKWLKTLPREGKKMLVKQVKKMPA
jgi:hypothetical protein